MNQHSSGLLLFRCIEGFLQFKAAEGVSAGTLVSYRQHLCAFREHVGDLAMGKVTAEPVRKFLAYMRSEYKPRRFAKGNTQPLAPKTLRNIWVTLSAFFTWAEKEFELASPMKLVPAPKFKYPPVETYSKEQVEAMLKACEWSVECTPNDRSKYVRRRPMNHRDRAIILMLLDTGLRANELCSLKIGDVDFQSGKVDVKHGAAGGAKGGKGRTVYMSRVTRKLVWRYLAGREDGEDAGEPLFIGMMNRKLTPFALRHMIKEIGQKAQVTKCYTHRFRHTFAITYLRSGGDVFTLQSLLGHGSLEMVQHYARVAQVDVEQAHRRASPVENWKL